jgi:FRG domain
MRTSVSTEVVTAKSWQHLQKLLFQHAWDQGIGRFRSRFVFRGIEDSEFRLETTLMRLGGPYAKLERHMLRNFRKYAPRSAVVQDTVWHWLTLGQHYGLPTRVLDWSISPFIALHFAVWHADHMHRPGAVWMIDMIKWRSTLPHKIERVRSNAGIWAFDTDSLAKIAESLPDFDRLSKRPFAVFYEPPSFDDRVVNQYAMLSALSDPSLAFDDWLETTPIPRRKVVIPARLKWEVRDKLDQCNINDRMLFPGLAGLCDWLKRFYGPGGSAAVRPKRPKRVSLTAAKKAKNMVVAR